jgi:asparagine synthase (glutamine-hydrolysing)
MSAIFGIFNICGGPVEERLLHKMEESVRHYGRHEQGVHVNGAIGFGCCLHNCGAHSHGDIPVIHDESNDVALVCDALIFNRLELIEKIGISGNRTISTQALLLAAYRKWDKDCPKQINGDFAFAIWDKSKQQLFLVRDHMGVRPLYYFYGNSIFAFATDYRALLALPFVSREINAANMYDNLVKICNFEPEATCFTAIKALPQAHTLTVDACGIHKRKYWTPGAGEKIHFKTEREYAQALYAIVEDAIKLRIHSVTGKIGGELSGGLDSSVITILASRELNKEGKNLDTVFSWSPPFEYIQTLPNDERCLLEKVCQNEKLEPVFFNPQISSNSDEIMPPEAADAVIIRQERSVMASHDIATILSGWGGDQGISHRTNLFGLLLAGYWKHFLTEISYLAKGSPLRFIKLLGYNSLYQLIKPYGYFGRPNKRVKNFISKTLAKKYRTRDTKEIVTLSFSPVEHLECGYIQTRTEQASWMDAAYSLQHLYPFLDYRVVDFAMSIPQHLYFKKGISRYIFREAFRSVLPEEIYRFTSKNDSAKSAYFTNTLPDALANVQQVANMLDRDAFADFIDFDGLAHYLKELAPDDKMNILLVKRRLLRCYYIQRILADSTPDVSRVRAVNGETV